MKKYTSSVYKYILLLGAVTSLTTCAEYDLESDQDEKPIRLVAGREYDPTRAVVTTDLQGPVFDAGETVNVWITGESSDYTTTTAIGETPNKFTTGTAVGGKNPLTLPDNNTLYYYTGSNSKIHVHAAYPANNGVDVKDSTTFTVQYDQTTERAYKNSDLMFVEPFDHNKTAEIVPLPFKHKMTKLIVNVVGDSEEGYTVTVDPTVTVGFIYRTMKIDVASGDFVVNTDSNSPGYYQGGPIVSDVAENSTDRTIKILNGGAALFPPQLLGSATRFITVTGTLNGEQRTAYFDIINKIFKEGHVYTLNLHVGKDDFTPQNDTPHTSTITGWSDDYDELTVTPSGGYAGVQIAMIDGTVTGANSKNGNYLYTGEPCCPKPTVTYGSVNPKVLTEGTDFRYVYVDNVNAGSDAQVMVIGMGSYTGLAALKAFTIERATATISFDDNTVKTVGFLPDENVGFRELTNTGDGIVTYSVIADGDGEDTDCASVDPTDGVVTLQNQGKCTIKATAVAGRNYDYPEPGNTCTYKLVIQPREVKVGNLSVVYEPMSFTYDGTVKRLTKLVVSETDGEHTLAEGVDYTYTLTDKAGRYEGLPIHSGTALLTVKGKGNYSESTKIEIDIPIYQATPTITVKETELALGKYNASAPKDRRKTREGTTEDWAKANLRYSLDASSDVTANTYISVGKTNGLLTGLKVHGSDPAATTVYVNVDADTSEYHDWVAATPKSFNVKVYESDFTFKINRYSVGKYREKQVKILSTGIPEGAHTLWEVPANGKWQIDCYGAQGGTTPKWTTEQDGVRRTTPPAIKETQYTNQGTGGRGAHIAGRIKLTKGMKLHVNLGQKGRVVYPGEQRLRGTASEICTVVLESSCATSGANKNGNIVNRGHNGGKVNGDLSYLRAGDYEWAAFAWNGGGGFVWGGRCIIYPTFYNQDNYYVGHAVSGNNSPAATENSADLAKTGQSYASFPITGGGGATDVSLYWDEEGGVYTPPSGLDNDADWNNNHNMVNREYGVGGTLGDSCNMVGVQWKNPAHLFSRIIVAGGGGGGLFYDNNKSYGDGGDGGAWEGTNGLYRDCGEGGHMNNGGRGGISLNWNMASDDSKTHGGVWAWDRTDNRTGEYEVSGTGTNYRSDLTYIDGPYGGGWSGTDGIFGEGGYTTQPAQGCGGGGGGWYGGGAGNEDSSNGTGGGGSSFVWTDQVKVKKYVSSKRQNRAGYGPNGSCGTNVVTYGAEVEMYKLYDTVDTDWVTFNTCISGGTTVIPTLVTMPTCLKRSLYTQFLPNNYYSSETTEEKKRFPFFDEIVTKDAGVNSGDGWAKITLVEIDDDQ